MLLVMIRTSHRWLMAIFLASSMAAVVLFFFNTRYRLPSVPVLAAAAGYFTAWAAGAVSARRWREALAAAALIAVFFGLVAGRTLYTVNRSATWTFLGNHYMGEGEVEKALEAFTTASELDPEGIENRINLARALNRTGMKEEARSQYAAAWQATPDFPNLALEYGYLLEELGVRDEARSLYNRAWDSGRKREMVVAAKLLSRMSHAEGDRGEAVRWIEEALKILPGDEELLSLLDRLEGP
jgi:tetratricopeptide (TPR) repeat protein